MLRRKVLGGMSALGILPHLAFGQTVAEGDMKIVETGGIRLATQAFGSPIDPPLVLIMGATASMLVWPDELCNALAERGLYVVRFDHRDTGQSTTLPPGKADYAVEDMAADVIGIMDDYKLERAHLLGMSLGGMIAQILALKHPDRVRTLTLIDSEPLGWDGSPLPHISQTFLDHFAALGSLDWSNHTAVADFLFKSERLNAGSGQDFDDRRMRARIEQILRRTDSPASMFNHVTLEMRENWTGRFREITAPVLVIHGEEDSILPVDNGRAIASGIEGADLLVMPGVGHELPLSRMPDIAERVASHALR